MTFGVGDRVRFVWPLPRPGGGPREVENYDYKNSEYTIQSVANNNVVRLRDPTYKDGWAVYSANLELADDADSYIPEDWS